MRHKYLNMQPYNTTTTTARETIRRRSRRRRRRSQKAKGEAFFGFLL